MPPFFIELYGKFNLKSSTLKSVLATSATRTIHSAHLIQAGAAFMDLEGLLKNIHHNR